MWEAIVFGTIGCAACALGIGIGAGIGGCIVYQNYTQPPAIVVEVERPNTP